jgi:hypothetical protein
MNKTEAIKAMEDGHKVTHKYFTDDEWMKMNSKSFEFEDGVTCSPLAFWKDRTGVEWEFGWEIYQE